MRTGTCPDTPNYNDYPNVPNFNPKKPNKDVKSSTPITLNNPNALCIQAIARAKVQKDFCKDPKVLGNRGCRGSRDIVGIAGAAGVSGVSEVVRVVGVVRGDRGNGYNLQTILKVDPCFTYI